MSQQLDPNIAKFLGKDPNQNTQNQGSDNQPQNNSQNSQKKLDNNVNNSYISEDGEGGDPNNAVDPETEKYQRILQQTFKGDVNKALKSWTEAQAALTEKSQELKKYKEPYEVFNSVLQKNPSLFDYVKRASQGEDVENLLRAKEPTGQPTSTNTASELENSIDEQALIKAGYLDGSRKTQLEDYQWQNEVLKATQRYMVTEYPKRIAQQTQAEIRKAQQAEAEKIRKEQEAQENRRRYTEGIKEAAVYGWDFNKDHAEVLDELEEEINGLRDSKNLNLIRQDAVEIALDRIARRRGIQLPQQQKPQAPMNLRNNQTNIQSRGTKNLQPEGPKDFLDAIIKKGMEINRNKNGDYLQRAKTRG